MNFIKRLKNLTNVKLLMGIAPVLSFLMIFSAFAKEVEERSLIFQLRSEISKNFNLARVEFKSPIQWVGGKKPGPTSKLKSLSFLGTDQKGNAHFSILYVAGQDLSISEAASSEFAEPELQNTGFAPQFAEGWVGFSAYIPAKVATRRVFPGEKLNSQAFQSRDVDISSGQGFEYRGVLLPNETDLSKLESVQSVLEGGFLLSTAVRKIPDIRRGDLVRVHLRSGDLVISTLATAEEPGYLKNQVRVMTQKNKREFLGMLKKDGVVEVVL